MSDIDHELLIENAAREVVRKYRIDPMILRDIANRLAVYEKGGEYVVRALGNADMSVDDVVADMRDDTKFRHRFDIDAEINKLDPAAHLNPGNATERINIARRQAKVGDTQPTGRNLELPEQLEGVDRLTAARRKLAGLDPNVPATPQKPTVNSHSEDANLTGANRLTFARRKQAGQ
jgi:hypothetical protein